MGRFDVIKDPVERSIYDMLWLLENLKIHEASFAADEPIFAHDIGVFMVRMERRGYYKRP